MLLAAGCSSQQPELLTHGQVSIWEARHAQDSNPPRALPPSPTTPCGVQSQAAADRLRRRCAPPPPQLRPCRSPSVCSSAAHGYNSTWRSALDAGKATWRRSQPAAAASCQPPAGGPNPVRRGGHQGLEAPLAPVEAARQAFQALGSRQASAGPAVTHCTQPFPSLPRPLSAAQTPPLAPCCLLSCTSRPACPA